MVQWLFIKGKRFFIILAKKDKFKSFIFLFILFSVYVFVFSESGILERMKLNKDYKTLAQRIATLESDNAAISDNLKQYSEGLYRDKDVIASGYVNNGGKVICFNEPASGVTDAEPKNNEFYIELSHLRVIWIIFSIVLMVYYYTRKKKEVEENHGEPFDPIRPE